MNWARSLYWRIAIGLVAFLALMLVIQAVLFTWVIARSGRTLPGQSAARFAETVALDVAAAMQRDPQVDLDKYVHEQFTHSEFPFAIVLRDGRVIASGTGVIPEPMVRGLRARIRRRGERQDGFERPQAEGPSGAGLAQPAQPGSPRFGRPAPIVVAGETVGFVVVPPRAPFVFLLQRFAPTLSLVAIGVLLLGTTGAALVIFGPARRRLRGLEDAARRIGAGDLTARAPDRGGDEIASVGRAFNAMAADLAARAEALAESDRVRRQLLADVSHELTTPVTAMRGYLETLVMPELALDGATRARYLGIVSDETARLERIIGDLLELSRLEGGGGGLATEPVPLADLFARVVARHERAAGAAGIRFTQAISAGAETVTGDRRRLEQALQNLASNAIRYAPAGSTIDLAAAPRGGRIAITVTDHGPGIAPEHLPHVFDRFYKADAARAGANGGSGLGLSIVRAIVERHGGRVVVNSVPGRTVFEIELPVRPR